MSFFGKIRDALFGTTPEVPTKPAPTDAPEAPAAAPAEKPAPKQQTGDAGLDRLPDNDAARDAAKQQEAPSSSARPRSERGTSPADALYSAAIEQAQLTGQGDISAADFIQLGEGAIKTLKGDANAIDTMVAEHAKRASDVQGALQDALDDLNDELLPNLDRATWDRLVKLTGFNMRNPPVGDRSPEALKRVRKELALFIANSDRFTLGPKIEREARVAALYKAVDALHAKLAYMGEIVERFGRAKKSIGKQITEIEKHIKDAKANPQRRISRGEAEKKLGREPMHRRREEIAVLRRAYEVCARHNKFESPAYSQLPWFWWYVFTGAQYDRFFRPKEVEDYMREHPEYKPPVPRPPRPPEEPEEPWPNPEPWPVPWPYPEPWPWPGPPES